MKILIKRLSRYPFLATELLIATFFITLLTLASPLFTIQILNRYVTYGFSGTLITLTAGMLIAILLQFAFRIIRTRIASVISIEPDTNLSKNVLNTLAKARVMPLSTIPKPAIHETITGLQTINAAYNAPSITSILDAPFLLIFVIATFFISSTLSYIASAGILLSLIAGALGIKLSQKKTESLQSSHTSHRGLVFSATSNIDTVRVFQGEKFLKNTWSQQISDINDLQKNIANSREFSQTMFITINVLMSVILYAVGAVEVVHGDLTIGGLIGANILAGRAFGSATKFVQTIHLLSKASKAFGDLERFFKIPLEPEAGTTPSEYNGSLEFKDLGFAYPASNTPLFESLNIKLGPGEIMAIVGYNGSGKTSLMRLIAGLLMPTRGCILCDGIDLRQIVPGWWRKQLVYLPQEPSFLNGTIGQNITLANPEIDNDALNEVISLAGLKRFLDLSPKGVETMILENGATLPIGIRRRIALSRALLSDGKLVVFDEPTEGLDTEGCQAIYGVLNKFAKESKNIIIVTRDPKILKGATYILDLSHKPVPVINKNFE